MISANRFGRGFLAGVIAEVGVMPFEYISAALGLTHFRYLDLASIILINHVPRTTSEVVLSQLILLASAGILGILFAYLIPAIGSENYRWKGAVYGVLIWLAAYFLTTTYKVPGANTISVLTNATNIVGSIIWGVFLAYVLKLIDILIHP